MYKNDNKKVKTKDMLDLNPKIGLQVEVRNNVLWVNVDGFCRLRATMPKGAEIQFVTDDFQSTITT